MGKNQKNWHLSCTRCGKLKTELNDFLIFLEDQYETIIETSFFRSSIIFVYKCHGSSAAVGYHPRYNLCGNRLPSWFGVPEHSNDYKAFTLLFDEYVVEAGPGVSRREGRKACQINVDMQFPQGWSYSIMDVDYRGYVSLDRGVTGVAQSDYYFQGQRGSARLSTTFRGPIDQDYEYRDSLGISAVVWSPCGASRSLNMKTQIRVDNNRARRGTGLLTVDSVDGQLEQVYGIQWRRCR